MKIYRYEDIIISLENVKEVHCISDVMGTRIYIHYKEEKCISSVLIIKKEEKEKIMNEIEKILKED